MLKFDEHIMVTNFGTRSKQLGHFLVCISLHIENKEAALM